MKDVQEWKIEIDKRKEKELDGLIYYVSIKFFGSGLIHNELMISVCFCSALIIFVFLDKWKSKHNVRCLYSNKWLF